MVAKERGLRVTYAPTSDTSAGEALTAAAVAELEPLRSTGGPDADTLGRGLLLYALSNLRVALEALQIRREWRSREGLR